MSVVYVKMEVSLHGLNAQSAQEIVNTVREILERRFGAEYESDVDVELIESAGSVKNSKKSPKTPKEDLS